MNPSHLIKVYHKFKHLDLPLSHPISEDSQSLILRDLWVAIKKELRDHGVELDWRVE